MKTQLYRPLVTLICIHHDTTVWRQRVLVHDVKILRIMLDTPLRTLPWVRGGGSLGSRVSLFLLEMFWSFGSLLKLDITALWQLFLHLGSPRFSGNRGLRVLNSSFLMRNLLMFQGFKRRKKALQVQNTPLNTVSISNSVSLCEWCCRLPETCS
jgi:hypothetical protein